MKRVVRTVCALVCLVLMLPAAACSDAAPNEATISIVITGDKVSPNGEMVPVAEGGKVTIDITSDVAEKIHVHGYEFEWDLAPGQSVHHEFTANLRGVYEIESHVSGKIIARLAVK